jgi:ribokinase
MSITIKDIASIAGVSATTVSMVINGKDDSISDETKVKVLSVIKKYNFKPYAKALQKSTARSGIIGLLVPENKGCFGEYIAGAENEAGSHGYSLMLCLTNNDDVAICRQLNDCYSKHVDGVSLYISHENNKDVLFDDAPENVKVNIVSGHQSWLQDSAAFGSFSEATRLATEHLLSMHHKGIALIGRGQDHYVFGDVLHGYGTALYDHDIVMQDKIVCKAETMDEVTEMIRNVIQGDFATAFICVGSSVTMRVYKELQRFKMQIPRDCSVICVSPDKGHDEVFLPELTAIDMQFYSLGQKAAYELIKQIEKSGKKKQGAYVIKPKLVKGSSTSSPPRRTGKRIVVVGSMHVDILIHTSNIPVAGESIISRKTVMLPGGKGANQAVGVAKLGGDVYAIGCLGVDGDGRLLYSSVESNGVNTTGVQMIQGKPTGKAYIIVANDGESTIVYSQGSNGELKPSVIDRYEDIFESADICLLSTEIPWETVEYTLAVCARQKVKVILKPTLQKKISSRLLKKITYLVPNEKELDIQVPGDFSVDEKAKRLYKSGVQNVVVTLGNKGCYLHNAEQKRFFPAADFTAVDTTGAADAFISAFAVYLSEEHGIIPSIKFATYAAGISITRDGVQSALADRNAVEIYSDKYGSNWPSVPPYH